MIVVFCGSVFSFVHSCLFYRFTEFIELNTAPNDLFVDFKHSVTFIVYDK